jgi:septum site-determining protein MinC
MGIAGMTDNILKSQAFKLKGRAYTFTVLHVLSADFDHFNQQWIETVNQAPLLFDNTPVVLDCSEIDGNQFDLQLFCRRLRERDVIPIAIQGGTPLLDTLARSQGLAVLHTSTQRQPLRKSKQKTIIEPPVEAIRTKLLTTPVRSGQQVVSKGGDLVITSAVSHGAELLADGHIHVYGALRGRALAGIAGDKQARIFCQSLDAELVSIAGYYRLSDTMEPITKPCQIFLRGEYIQIEPL